MDKPVMITRMVEEEVNNFLNKSHMIGGDSFKFSTPVRKTFFNNYDTFTTEYDTDVVESNIIVTWSLSFQLNDMGVQNFIIDVQNVEGTFTLQMLDKHTDEVVQETPKNISEFQWSYVINPANALLTMNKSLYIRDLEFDFKRKTCTVGF